MNSMIKAGIALLVIILWLAGMAVAYGMERNRTAKPEPLFYRLWPIWLVLWVVVAVWDLSWRHGRQLVDRLDSLGQGIAHRWG